MYQQALTLLGALAPANIDLQTEFLAIEGVADARLHHFAEADDILGRAVRLCQSSPTPQCGDVMRARGILAVQSGRVGSAVVFFEQSLQFARTTDNHFLEASALLNLGLAAIQEARFDEAIDFTNAAYQAASELEAGNIIQTCLGNLGWAYYNLGDFDKSLELSLEAEKRASQVENVILQLSWITNTGYVYASRRDLGGAKEAYSKALELANQTGGREDVFNAFRALALVSVESGDLDAASNYSDQAIAIAQSDHNRLDELYPLLVKGMIAARQHNDSEAERIFCEVDTDSNANAALHWRSEHALAQLYEDEGHSDAAEREYRIALATFESARSSLQRNDSKLPFSNNASRIYDDYIHFLVAHGKTEDALRWADYSRARTLAEGLGLLSNKPTSGQPSASLPPLNPQQIARQANGTVLFYWLGEKQSYLWAITAQKASLFSLPTRSEIEAAVKRYSRSLGGPRDVLASADPDGIWLYRNLVAPAQTLLKSSPHKDARIFIIPDGNLNNLNFETLLVTDADTNPATAKLHYWIEDVTLSNASSLRVLGASHNSMERRASSSGQYEIIQRNLKTPRNRPTLLLVGNSVSPNSKYPELPKAAKQMESVARHFPGDAAQIFAREQATPAAYLDSRPERFSYIHFVAHGTASRLSPLDSAIVLSKTAASNPEPPSTPFKAVTSNAPPAAISAEADSFKLYARDIVGHPLHANLVTISACYGAGERAYSGEGLVGLSWAFLFAGAHNVVAALWEASDASTEQLMDKFYDELDRGASPDAALRTAKLSLLRASNFRNPFYWAPFQLYAGS